MNSPGRAGPPSEAETSRSGRAGQQRGAAIDPALRPRRSGNEGAAAISPRRSPLHPAAQAGSSRPARTHAPLTMAQDLEQWRHAAELDLPNNNLLDFDHRGLEGDDSRLVHLRNIAEAVITAARQHSTRLVIEYVPAAALPQSIGWLPHLQELSLLQSECTKLPDSIGNLANLTTLVLVGHTKIKHLPDGITRLGKLTTLHATDMPLEALPQGIGELRSLEKLGLRNQRSLSTLPDSLTDLHQLQDLNLAGCSTLTELPSRLDRLRNLKTLTLKRNQGLRHLPERLGKLARLEELDLKHCTNLQDLPANLWGLQQLKKLDLTGCTSLRELPESLRLLPANCQILVPHGLEAQLRDLRPPRRRAARPIHMPRPVADPRVTAWKERLAPYAEEGGANRFSQWMDAVSQGPSGLSRRDAAKMERIVQAAGASAALRARLFDFAAAQVQLQRNPETGVTTTHTPATTFTGVNEAHDVYLAHMVSDPRHAAPDAARALLVETIHERYGSMAPAQAIQRLAGDAPTGTEADRYASGPWPALVAYVQTHDEEGRAIAANGVAQLDHLGELSDARKINENEMLKGHANVQAANKLLMHERLAAVAAELLAYRSVERLPALTPALR
jgi:hypothetical protein